eukprot:SAG11_NODE_3495_length_2412_cov_1.966278_1_plen_90_part_00
MSPTFVWFSTALILSFWPTARPSFDFQIAQDTPPEVRIHQTCLFFAPYDIRAMLRFDRQVWAAYKLLVAAGYTWNLVTLDDSEAPIGGL